MLTSLVSNRHALGCSAACLLMSILNSKEVHRNKTTAVPGNHEQVTCVIVCKLNGHANGPDIPPRPTTQSSGVLGWAYPSVGAPILAQGQPAKQGMASTAW